MNDTRELIARYYAAFNARNWRDMLDCVSEGVRHDVNEGSQRGGRDMFRAFLAHMDRCYEEQLIDIVIMVSPDGRRAAAEFVVDGLYKETDGDLPPARGQRYRLPAGAFFAVEAGRIDRVTTYYNLNEWVRQVS